MTAAVSIDPPRSKPRFTPNAALEAAAKAWWGVAFIGQLLFLYYILAFYFPSTLTGKFQLWALNTSLFKGYVPGDTPGNLAFGAHVLLAGVVTFAGTLQLVPQIRARAPAVHRWIGRAFLVTAIGGSLAGLYMTWARLPQGLLGEIAISIDAAMIFLFGGLAWRTALKRDFASHRRWALRAFLAANAVWFMRVGFAPVGILFKLIDAPHGWMTIFYNLWSFGSYLLPLAVLELYFRAGERGGDGARYAMAGGLSILTLLMGVGVVGTWFGFFAPILGKL